MKKFQTIPRVTAIFAASCLVPAGGLLAQDGQRPSLNQYGRVGLIDMPSAESLPDAELSFSVVRFAGTTRSTLNFQFHPRLSGAFRYSGIGNWRYGGTLYDRSFDLSYRFMDESRYRPALAIGLQDFMGTGQYSSQYLVATKNIGSTLKVTAGLGWGRLSGSDTQQNIDYGLGGKPNFSAWFRGTPGFFGGLEWQTPVKGLRLKAEYSPDRYVSENTVTNLRTSPSFKRKSPLNVGFSYMTKRNLQISGYYMHGSTVGLSFSMALNPKRTRQFLKPRAQPPQIAIAQRSKSSLKNAVVFTGSDVQDLSAHYTTKIQGLLNKEAILVVATDISGAKATVKIRNHVFPKPGEAIERTLRAMSQTMPNNINSFSIVLIENGLPVSKSNIQRSKLEAIGADVTGQMSFANALTVEDAETGRSDKSMTVDGIYPKLSSYITPAFIPHLFDPEDPLRADVRAIWHTKFDISPGLSLSSSISAKLFGNLSDNKRGSNSRIEHVRTDLMNYQQNTDVTIDRLTVDYLTKFSPDLYGRINAGIFEQMYGGVSAELLWAPAKSRLAFGAEVSWAKKRSYKQHLKFRDYSVVTGHVSAYWDIGNNYYGQIDVGRYLAGDIGGTLSLERRFENGWRVGAFATLTNVSFDDFGEGSFDKGITITVPFEWLSGKKTRRAHATTIRSVTRDGGARLSVPNRLYDVVSSGSKNRVLHSW